MRWVGSSVLGSAGGIFSPLEGISCARARGVQATRIRRKNMCRREVNNLGRGIFVQRMVWFLKISKLHINMQGLLDYSAFAKAYN